MARWLLLAGVLAAIGVAAVPASAGGPRARVAHMRPAPASVRAAYAVFRRPPRASDYPSRGRNAIVREHRAAMVTRLLGGTAANRDRVWATAGERKLCLSEEFRGGAASGCMPFDDAGRPPPEVIMVTIHQFRDDSPVIDNTLTALLADGTHDARRVESDGTVTPLSLTGNLLKVVVTPDHPASIAWTQADGTAGNVLGAFGGQLPLDLNRPPTR